MHTIDQPEAEATQGITTAKRYPDLMVRVKAALTDVGVIIGLMVFFTYLFDSMKEVPEWARISSFVFVWLLYEPLCVTIFKATIGHFIMGLRVVDSANEEKRLSIFPAILRYVFKVLLGWISFITISSNEKSKAIHDIVAYSVVIIHKFRNQ